MADARLIDGKAFAGGLRQRVGAGVADFVATGGPKPGLATVLVGADPASQVYVRSKGKLAVELGMASFDHQLPEDTTQAELLELIGAPQRRSLGQRHPGPAAAAQASRHGAGSDRHRSGQGCRRLPSGECRPSRLDRAGRAARLPGAVHAARLSRCCCRMRWARWPGLNAVIVGRSNLVGSPRARNCCCALDCTVTITHSRTARPARRVPPGRYPGRGDRQDRSS